jgi:uncharacterized protein (DUF58 family)
MTMRFLLRGRFFILPAAGAAVLLFQNWLPAARLVCIALNALALMIAAVEYFLMPDTRCFSFSRTLPRQFFHRREGVVTVTVRAALPVPVVITLQDRPPDFFRDSDPQFIFTAGSGVHEYSCAYAVTPRRRGEFCFGAVGVRMTTRIGFVARQFIAPVEQRVVVYPRFPRRGEEFLSRFYTTVLPNRAMRSYGPGCEFYQMRDYRAGDDIRAVHWKRSARSGAMIVREFEPEKGQNIMLMVDGGRLMMAEYLEMTKVDWAFSACMALAEEALRRHDAVGLACFSNAVDRYVAPSNKEHQLSLLIESASRFKPQFLEPDYGSVFRWTFSALKNRSIVLLFTDFFDAYLSRELYAHILLLRKKHRVVCCVLTHPEMERLGNAADASVRGATTAAVIRESIDNRKTILEELRRSGVDIVDTAPEELGGAVLSAYTKARWR